MSVILTITGCRLLYQEKPSHAPDTYSSLPNGLSKDQLSYALVRDRIINPRCIECHGPNDEIDLSTYSQVIANLNDIKKDVFVLKKMPKRRAPLDSDEASILSTWIDMGAPENATEPNSNPTSNPSPSPSPVASPILTQLEPTFNSISKNIFQPKCVKCHSPQGEAADDLLLKTYEDILAKKPIFTNTPTKEAKILRVITTSDLEERMPPPEDGPALTDTEISVIRKWIDLGLPKDSPTEPPAPIDNGGPIKPVYSEIQRRIITPSCNGCHNPKGKAKDFPFETYEQIFTPKLITPEKPEKSKFYTVLVGSKPKMPRKAPPLTLEETSAIKSWIEQGAKNN